MIVRGLSEFNIITKNSVFKDFIKFCGSIIIMTKQLNEKLINDYTQEDFLFININGQPFKRNSCQQALIYHIGKQRGVK